MAAHKLGDWFNLYTEHYFFLLSQIDCFLRYASTRKKVTIWDNFSVTMDPQNKNQDILNRTNPDAANKKNRQERTLRVEMVCVNKDMKLQQLKTLI